MRSISALGGVLALVLVALDARGEMLLVTLHWDHDAETGLPAWYGAVVGGSLSFHAEGEGSPPFQVVHSLPVSKTASQLTIDWWNEFNSQLGINGFVFFVEDLSGGGDVGTGPGYDSGWFTQGEWEDGLVTGCGFEVCDPGVWTVTSSAPSRGKGLVGYTLTRAEQTLSEAGQTLRIWGVEAPPVPEPASASMLLIALVHFVALRPPRFGIPCR